MILAGQHLSWSHKLSTTCPPDDSTTSRSRQQIDNCKWRQRRRRRQKNRLVLLDQKPKQWISIEKVKSRCCRRGGAITILFLYYLKNLLFPKRQHSLLLLLSSSHLLISILLLHVMFFDKLLPAASSASSSIKHIKMFKSVCLGGTFDGIHVGHKLLLGEATKICKERLVIGVSDDQMIRRKVLWELITPYEERVRKLRDYLQHNNSTLTYQIHPLPDIYGPAVSDKELDCIVVSEETVKGASKINEVRRSKGWPELQVHVVNLIPDTNSTNQDSLSRLKEHKVSSSLMRIQKLGTILKPPTPNDTIPRRPYLIGLTGGIASGKTAIAKYLQSLGMGCVNYDLTAHKTYEQVGSPVYKQIVDYFGSQNILNDTNQQIDRSKLGRIVFSDRAKLDQLNAIVWPAMYELVDQQIEQMKSKYEIIVLESALLVESNQTKRVHQIWTAIIPPEVAVERQMESRGFSREEAEKRVNSQTDNITRVRSANAVFCSLWEPEFTHKQVDRCVQELREKYL